MFIMEGINGIFETIGQNIVKVIAEDWKEATLNIEVIEMDNFVSYKGYYISELENKKVPLKVSRFSNEIVDDIRSLHKITTENDRSKWNRGVFTITPDNKFNMKFVWDQELQDEIERLSKRS